MIKLKELYAIKKKFQNIETLIPISNLTPISPLRCLEVMFGDDLENNPSNYGCI